MKKIFLILLTTFALSCCNKDDDTPSCQGIDCLPPATQTGAGTFGCLVNGEPYVDNSGFFNCFYQLVDGEYYFSISAENTNSIPRNIRISTSAFEIFENNTYQLIEPMDGNAHAAVIFNFNGVQTNENTTDTQYTGNLTITKLDAQNKVVSGIFNFQILDIINNKVYNITDGRFDTQYTQ